MDEPPSPGSGVGAPPPAATRGEQLVGEAVVSTLPQQALWYRLVGDRNALHHDPELARRAGFDGPLLQGLCTWAMVGKALVDDALGGDVGVVARFAARFSGPVFPGEALRVRWRDDGTVVRAEVDTAGRATPALREVVLRRRGVAAARAPQ